MTDPKYNPIYESLVDSAADDRDTLVGLIAYGLYKRSKRKWIRQRHERQGIQPSDAEVLHMSNPGRTTVLMD